MEGRQKYGRRWTIRRVMKSSKWEMAVAWITLGQERGGVISGDILVVEQVVMESASGLIRFTLTSSPVSKPSFQGSTETTHSWVGPRDQRCPFYSSRVPKDLCTKVWRAPRESHSTAKSSQCLFNGQDAWYKFLKLQIYFPNFSSVLPCGNSLMFKAIGLLGLDSSVEAYVKLRFSQRQGWAFRQSPNLSLGCHSHWLWVAWMTFLNYL